MWRLALRPASALLWAATEQEIHCLAVVAILAAREILVVDSVVKLAASGAEPGLRLA